ncbi:MAG: bifunctional riboflavin kinase/FAD synthetase [Planctomycetia bacterium]|nr:bifunctional riboflavin kinase/FAD synthetase [Planctomycetia bacterium]
MIYWQAEEPLPREFSHCAATIGNFDGVHKGHAAIVSRLKIRTRPSVVFTFSPHPRQILRPESAPPLLTRDERKVELLKSLGVDLVVICKPQRLLEWSPEEFFRRIVVEYLHAEMLSEGENFHFGKNRSGNTQVLKRLCHDAGVVLHIAPSFRMPSGEKVSSTKIRELLEAGDVERANAMLIQPYRIEGVVGHGLARGRTLGFRTANLVDVETLVPGSGAYACWAYFEGKRHAAAISVGPNVTFGENQTKIEIHLLDFEGDIYGKRMEVEFIAKLRDLVVFDSKEALSAQIEKDIQTTRTLLQQETQ